MISHSFQTGEDLAIDAAPYVIVNIHDEGSVYQLRNKASGALRNLSRRELLQGYVTGTIKFVGYAAETSGRHEAPSEAARHTTLDALTEPARKETLRRRTYLKRLETRGALRFDRSGNIEREIATIANDLGDQKPPHRSTIHRWHQQWVKRRRDLQSVAREFRRRGAPGVGRHGDEVEGIIVRAIDKIYLTLQRNTAKETWEAIVAEVKNENLQRDPTDLLPIPSLRTIQRRISKLSAYECVARREGEAVARRRFRKVLGVLKAHTILERVEMDHTPLNLFVVDEGTWLPLGRPTLTVALDRASRMLLGYWIGFTGNGVDAVLGCLRHAIRPKTYLADRYPDIRLGWPTYGLPKTLWVDNGMEFAGHDLKTACEDLGVDLFFLPARKPEWKGSVERFLKTINHALIHRLPGTTFENISARGDYDSEQYAVVSLTNLERLIETWVCDVYHNEVHRGLNARPIDIWTKGVAAEEPALPSDIGRLDFQLGECEERTLWHYGVELWGQHYNSYDLAAVHARVGRVRLRIRYHRSDISRVWVEDPVSKEFFEVPNTDPTYSRGLTLEQHTFIRTKAKKEAHGRVDREALMKAKELLRKEIEQLLMARKLSDRRRGGRLSGKNSGALRDDDRKLPREYVQHQQDTADGRNTHEDRETDDKGDPTTGQKPSRAMAPLTFTVRDPGAST